MKNLFAALILCYCSTHLFAQEVLFTPVFINECTREIIRCPDYFLTDDSTTYESKSTYKYLVLPRTGMYWLHVDVLDFSEIPIKVHLKSQKNIDSFSDFETYSIEIFEKGISSRKIKAYPDDVIFYKRKNGIWVEAKTISRTFREEYLDEWFTY